MKSIILHNFLWKSTYMLNVRITNMTNSVLERYILMINISECLAIDLNNAVIMGNMNGVANKIKFRCNEGYAVRTRSSRNNIVCMDNGTWNTSGVCEKRKYYLNFEYHWFPRCSVFVYNQPRYLMKQNLHNSSLNYIK